MASAVRFPRRLARSGEKTIRRLPRHLPGDAEKMDESIAKRADREILYDQLVISKNKLRITGPFTVETVPFATLLGLDEVEQPKQADVAAACRLRTV
jgi:hypothetical protein